MKNNKFDLVVLNAKSIKEEMQKIKSVLDATTKHDETLLKAYNIQLEVLISQFKDVERMAKDPSFKIDSSLVEKRQQIYNCLATIVSKKQKKKTQTFEK